MRLRRVIKYLANLLTPMESNTNFAAWEFKNKLLRWTTITIGKKVAIGPGFECLTGNEQNITIEDYVALGHNIKLYNFGPIKIGSFTTLAADVTLTNGGHEPSTLKPFSGEINIGRGCWFGHGARVVRPVSIGDNVIVAAGAIVINNIPSGSIVAGVPAKIIKMRTPADKVWFLGDTYFDPLTFKLASKEII